MDKMIMLKRKSFMLSMIFSILTFMLIFSLGETTLAAEAYPAQFARIENVDNGQNMNILGFLNDSEINTWVTNGEENERWEFRTTDGTNFKIINKKTGLVLSPYKWSVKNGNKCVLYKDSNKNEQLWRIVGVDKDVNGDYYSYKIVNKVNNSIAAVLDKNAKKVVLGNYKNNSNHKWKLVSDGLEGFAGYSKDLNGRSKTGTIGGLLGKTVFVNNLSELKSALLKKEPLTVVINKNIDNCNSEVYDLRIESNKTIIGSYNANRLTDARLRTDDYFGKEGVSNNIIIKNVDFEVKERRDVVCILVYGSRNVWIDHCTFNSTLGIDKGEVGKYIWVNTSANFNTDPDYVTVSYNKFSNRYWTVAFGTKEGLNKNNATLINNYFDSCNRRTPQSGNGRLHVLNNLIEINKRSTSNDGYAALIAGAGCNLYSEANRFNNFKSSYRDAEITIDSKATGKDVESYTNKDSKSPYVLQAPTGKVTSFNPNNYYKYTVIKSYDANGNDIEKFCKTYSGSFNNAKSFKYANYSELKSFIK